MLNMGFGSSILDEKKKREELLKLIKEQYEGGSSPDPYDPTPDINSAARQMQLSPLMLKVQIKQGNIGKDVLIQRGGLSEPSAGRLIQNLVPSTAGRVDTPTPQAGLPAVDLPPALPPPPPPPPARESVQPKTSGMPGSGHFRQPEPPTPLEPPSGTYYKRPTPRPQVEYKRPSGSGYHQNDLIKGLVQEIVPPSPSGPRSVRGEAIPNRVVPPEEEIVSGGPETTPNPYEDEPVEPYVPGGGRTPTSTTAKKERLDRLTPGVEAEGPSRPSSRPGLLERLLGPKDDLDAKAPSKLATALGGALGISPTSLGKGFGLLGKMGLMAGMMGGKQAPPPLPDMPTPQSPDFAGAYQQKFQEEAAPEDASPEQLAAMSPMEIADYERRRRKAALSMLS